MNGGEAERAREDVQACKNVIEVWLRVFDLRGSPPPITWAHLSDLADAFAGLLAAERAAALAAQAAPLEDAQFAARAAQQALSAYVAEHEAEAAQTRALRIVPVTQRTDGCYAACVASVTGIALDEVPHPTEEELGQSWTVYANRSHKWLQERGYFKTWLPPFWPPAGLSIVHGEGPRGFGHCCVAIDGVIVHDPYPHGGGLTAIEGYEVLVARAALPGAPRELFQRGFGAMPPLPDSDPRGAPREEPA